MRPPFDSYEPQDPVTAEAKLDAFSDELEEARKLLAKARDAEVTAQEIRDDAYRAAILSDECPKVGVFGGVRTTVAYQQAWIAKQIKDQERLFQRAKLARQEAADKHRTLASQASHQQTLTKSVGDAYRRSGRQI